MAYLITLGCPPGGLVVDPFAGTGTTGIAALLQGMDYLLIEKEERWANIARLRLKHWELYRGDAPRVEAVPGVEQVGLGI
jgi:site-specific DNA-methyltransferase (adenine-specific)